MAASIGRLLRRTALPSLFRKNLSSTPAAPPAAAAAAAAPPGNGFFQRLDETNFEKFQEILTPDSIHVESLKKVVQCTDAAYVAQKGGLLVNHQLNDTTRFVSMYIESESTENVESFYAECSKWLQSQHSATAGARVKYIVATDDRGSEFLQGKGMKVINKIGSYGGNLDTLDLKDKLLDSSELKIVPLTALQWSKTGQYDATVLKGAKDRVEPIKLFSKMKGTVEFAGLKKGQVVGIGLARPSLSGYEIGPLYANDDIIAANLVYKMSKSMKVTKNILMVTFNVPHQSNEIAKKFVEHLRLKRVKTFYHLAFNSDDGPAALPPAKSKSAPTDVVQVEYGRVFSVFHPLLHLI